jgi:putative LysE/RhtB family amino acid efflux pump
MTILSFTAAFGALGLATGLAAGSLVAGVFLGSAVWWLILSGASSMFRGRLGPRALVWVHRASGLLIGGFGALALAAAWAA